MSTHNLCLRAKIRKKIVTLPQFYYIKGSTLSGHVSMMLFFVRMASVVDKLKKRKDSKTEWSKTGSFLNKPDRGWIHPDEQLAAGAGICYGVRVGTQGDNEPSRSGKICLCGFQPGCQV